MNPTPEPDSPETEETSAVAMAARAVFLGYLGGVAAAPILLMLTLSTGRLLALGGSLLSVAIAGFCRLWLQSQGRFESTKARFDAVSTGTDLTTPQGQRAQFIELLRAWDDLEHKRGSPAFDPWAAQAVRHSIREMIAGDPALERLFHT